MSAPFILAHGVGQVYESPIPAWLYAVGAGTTVALSFVVRALVKDRPDARAERMLLGPRGAGRLRLLLRSAGVVALALMIVAGLVTRELGLTTTTLLFWVGLFVTTTVLSTVVAGVWEASDPWHTLEDLYRLEDGPVETREPPWWLGPLLLYALFWFELISGVGFEDIWIVMIAIGYALFAFSVRGAYGDAWRSVDPFSILFGFAARCAPMRLSERGMFTKRPLEELGRNDPMPRGLYVAVFILLASTTLDNVRETVGWTNFLDATGLDGIDSKLVDSVALLAFATLFFAPFLVSIWIARRWLTDSGSGRDVARRFGWSLAPIGVAYVLAHNAPLLISGAPLLLRALSDPFQMGWNLFGTANLFQGFAASPKLVWFLEIALIVGGHLLAILAAHRTAVRMAPDHRSAINSQYALTALMTLYTISTLALLAQPLVA